jgi:hypothetical protein
LALGSNTAPPDAASSNAASPQAVSPDAVSIAYPFATSSRDSRPWKIRPLREQDLSE